MPVELAWHWQEVAEAGDRKIERLESALMLADATTKATEWQYRHSADENVKLRAQLETWLRLSEETDDRLTLAMRERTKLLLGL